MRKKVKINCELCGKEHWVLKQHLNAGAKFCSHSCSAKYRQLISPTPKAPGTASQRYRSLHPEKAKAHSVVDHAIEDGSLVKKPCEVCGDLKVQAHHPDYSKPLEIVWLCVKHHYELHQLLASTSPFSHATHGTLNPGR